MVGINPQTKPGKPCEMCRWPYPGFHICIDKTDPKVREVVLSPIQKANQQRNRHYSTKRSTLSEEHKANLSISAQERWAEHHAALIPRNNEIVRLYMEEKYSVRDLVKLFEISQDTVVKVLHKARDNGLVVMRPVGKNKSSI